MKQYKFFTLEETAKHYLGDGKDICYLEVEKPNYAKKVSDFFLIAIEPNFTFHIFDSKDRHLTLCPFEIKKISIQYHVFLYLFPAFFLSIPVYHTFYVFIAEIFFIPINDLFIGALYAFSFFLIIYLLRKTFYCRKIKIKTIYHTTYSYYYDCLSTSSSENAFRIDKFEKWITLFNKKYNPK